jgi:hypothetical protein
MAATGLRADETGYNKILAPGMTNTPKSRWGFNSVLNDVPAKDAAADKAKNAKVVADPNAGAPKDEEPVSEEKRNAAIAAAAKDAPNPVAVDADPATDPAAVAAAENKMEDESSKKAEKKDAAAKAPAAAFIAPPLNPADAPKAALAQMRDVNGDPTKIDSVKGPPGAPIGYGVHKLALEGGNPYAAKQMYRAEEPVPNLQHQPVILQPGVAPAAPAAKEMSPEMAYRTKIGEEGVLAADAGYNKMTSAGMTDTPKVRFNNSILAPASEGEAVDKAKNAAVKADPNAKPAAGEVKAPVAEAKAADAKAPAAAAKAPADAATGAPLAAALMQKQDTIGEPKYDYSVYNFAHNAIYDPLESARQTDGPYSNNGY